MTVRESAIKAMEELGYTKARIASIINFMDTHEPHFISETQDEIPPELEAETIEIAKRYFRGANTIPSDN